jgi:hypothetical protein
VKRGVRAIDLPLGRYGPRWTRGEGAVDWPNKQKVRLSPYLGIRGACTPAASGCREGTRGDLFIRCMESWFPAWTRPCALYHGASMGSGRLAKATNATRSAMQGNSPHKLRQASERQQELPMKGTARRATCATVASPSRSRWFPRKCRRKTKLHF